MLIKLCAERHSKCEWPRGRKHHTWRLDSCLQWRQHSPRSSAPGLAALLSLPRADGLLPWGTRHWQAAPGALACGCLCREGLAWEAIEAGLEGGLLLEGWARGRVHLEPAGVPALEEGRRWLTRDRGDSPLKERFEADRPVPRKEWRGGWEAFPWEKQINEKWWSFLSQKADETHKNQLTL